MSRFKELTDKYQEDIKLLQESCPHVKVDTASYFWAPGHSNGKVKYCLECEKIIEHYPDAPYEYQTLISNIDPTI